jgi:hypothetical protein
MTMSVIRPSATVRTSITRSQHSRPVAGTGPADVVQVPT